MRKLFNGLIAKTLDLLNWLGFTKLKVFYQILIIIGFMIICFAILGYTTFDIIGRMQETTQQVFNKSATTQSDINKVKNNLNDLSRMYAETLANLDSYGVNMRRGRELIATTKGDIGAIFGLSDENRKELLVFLDELAAVFNSPPGSGNYRELQSTLAGFNQKITRIAQSVTGDTNDIINQFNDYSAGAKTVTWVLLIFSALTAVMCGLIVATAISRPLNTVSVAAQSLGEGNLAQNIQANGSPEVAGVVKGLNQALVGLRRMIAGIDNQSGTLFGSSRELNDLIEQTGESAQQVARAMEELANSASEHTIQVNQAVDTVHDLSELVKKVSDDTTAIAEASVKVASSARLGQQASSDVAHDMNELFKSTQEVSDVINKLNKASEEIGEIITVIGGIAEQTTLLALNASIEAARAGEHGRGFGVVASETGKLAEQSKQAAGMIVALVSQMSELIGQAVAVMQKGMTLAGVGKNRANEATVTFEGIFTSLRDVLGQIDKVAVSAQSMAERNNKVISAMHNIAAISEETMASSQEVSATAQQQSASLQQVSQLAENLRIVAANLKDSVNAFCI